MSSGNIISYGPDQGLGREDRCTRDGVLRDLPSVQSADHPEVCECCIEAFYVACPACGDWVRDLAAHDYQDDPYGPTCDGQDLDVYNSALVARYAHAVARHDG